MKNKKLRKINITKGISFSKTRSKWVCSWCEEPIKDGEETILFQGLEKGYTEQPSVKISGARIHLDCMAPMCKSLKTIKDNKEKYAILNSLDMDK